MCIRQRDRDFFSGDAKKVLAPTVCYGSRQPIKITASPAVESEREFLRGLDGFLRLNLLLGGSSRAYKKK